MEHKIASSWPDWEIGALLGTGSSGSVYEIRRGKDDGAERSALKIISIPKTAGELDKLYEKGHTKEGLAAHFKGYCENLAQEYRALSELKGSSNLVSVEEVRAVPHEDGVGWDLCVRMELLTPMIKTLGESVSEEEVIKLGMHICTALCACGEHGIIHRDIKPTNIFVSGDGSYKLGDHGMGKTAERMQTRARAASIRYMPPEFYAGQPFGAGADTYSLGLVMYWLLNQRRAPFLPLPPAQVTPQDAAAAQERVQRGEALPAPVDGSERLQTIVLKACAFNPADRYQSPADMLADLKELNRDVMSDDLIRGVVTSLIGAEAAQRELEPVKTAPVSEPVAPVQTHASGDTIRMAPVIPQPIPQPAVQSVVQTAPRQEKKQSSRKGGVILLIVVAVLLVLTLLAGAVTLVIRSDILEKFFVSDNAGQDTQPDETPDHTDETDDTGDEAEPDPEPEVEPVVWSDWTDTLPDFVFDGTYVVQSKLQYRSAPLCYFEGAVENEQDYTVCYTGYTEWGAPGEWRDAPIQESELVKVEVGARYRYRDLYSYKYCEGFVTKTGYAWGEWQYSSSPVQAKSGREIEEIPIYRCRTRLKTYYCAKNSEWSEYGDEVIHPSQITVVSTRMVYSYAKCETPPPSMENFPQSVPQYISRFVDVPNDSWYGANTDNWVGTAVELGAMSANEFLCFRPTEHVTVGEVIKAAVALRLIYNGSGAVLPKTTPWYQSYVDYAVEQGMIAAGDFSDFTKKATREEAAYILSSALPAEEMSGNNLVTAILDMTPSSPYYMAVYRLAQAGVISWTAPEGTFQPGDLITRAEIAAMISRIAYPDKRIVSDVQ